MSTKKFQMVNNYKALAKIFFTKIFLNILERGPDTFFEKSLTNITTLF
jgi:hypothetical protein